MDTISRLPLCNHLLQQALRGVCAESEWVYSVFWRILPRNFPPPKWELGGYLERSKANKRNWILVWEDGFCDFARSIRRANQILDAEDAEGDGVAGEQPSLHPELFFKMSHEIYNYGEGLMGKVAADSGHKWIFREPPDCDNRLLSFWHNTIDPQPRTWEAQFKCGIQTIVVVAVHEGLVQLGSNRQILEDLNFVGLVQRKFNGLQQELAARTSPSLVDHQSTSSLQRKMRHARSDEDEWDQPAFAHGTMERRLSWTSTSDSARRSRPPPPPLSPTQYYNDTSYSTFQQQLPLPLARDVQAAADHLYNSKSTALPAAGIRQGQSGNHLDMQSHASCCSSIASATVSCAAASTSSVPLSMSTLQALMSKLPAMTTTSLAALEQQSNVNGKPGVQNHFPLLRTLSSPAPARSSISSTTYCGERNNNIVPDSAWRNVMPSSCDQLLSFQLCTSDSFLATSPSSQQHKFEQCEPNMVVGSLDHNMICKGMVQLQSLESPAVLAKVQSVEAEEEPGATAGVHMDDRQSFQKHGGGNNPQTPGEVHVTCTQ